MRARPIVAAALAIAATLLGAPESPRAAEPAEPDEIAAGPEDDPPVRAQVRRYLAARLGAEIGLSDLQIEALMPRLDTLERVRAEARRDRVGLVRDLRRGMARGASDAELDRLLRRLDDVAVREAEGVRRAFTAIDADLAVRQRVQMRFVLARFRGDLARRVEDLRGREERRGGRPPRAKGDRLR